MPHEMQETVTLLFYERIRSKENHVHQL